MSKRKPAKKSKPKRPTRAVARQGAPARPRQRKLRRQAQATRRPAKTAPLDDAAGPPDDPVHPACLPTTAQTRHPPLPRRPTPKQVRFAAEYLVDLNATKAAERAGYSPGCSDVTGARLLAKASIAALVAAGAKRQLERADLSAARTLEEMRRLAFSNVQDLFDANGDLKPIQSLTREQAACIASIEVVMKNAAAGDGKIDRVLKIKVWDKPKVLEMVGRHFRLLEPDFQPRVVVEKLVILIQRKPPEVA